jgi:hypothetical protein
MTKDEPFPIGSKVWLRRAQYGMAGTVVRLVRGRVVVLWPGERRLFQHRPDALVLASDDEERP